MNEYEISKLKILLKHGFKEGKHYLVREWNPKKGYHYKRRKFSWFGPVHEDIHPNFQYGTGCLPVVVNKLHVKINNQDIEI